MIEVGDMIHYNDWNQHRAADDIGWVVYVEKHLKNDSSAYLIYVRWLNEDTTDAMWDYELIEQTEAFTLIKGEQHAK
tara:strand:- start:733 stop:963 length:231 start_codon:yes stop_codon:yes gene_type:complete